MLLGAFIAASGLFVLALCVLWAAAIVPGYLARREIIEKYRGRQPELSEDRIWQVMLRDYFGVVLIQAFVGIQAFLVTTVVVIGLAMAGVRILQMIF